MDNWWNKLALVATVGLAAVGVIGVGTGRAADLPVKAPAPKVAPYSFAGCGPFVSELDISLKSLGPI